MVVAAVVEIGLDRGSLHGGKTVANPQALYAFAGFRHPDHILFKPRHDVSG